MISLIFALIFFIIFIFLFIASGNFLLKTMINNVLSKENFENFDNNEKSYNNIIVNPIDDCRKIDQLSQDNLNFQTATNIPLSPNNYKNYIGSIYMNDDDNYVENKSELHKGKYLYLSSTKKIVPILSIKLKLQYTSFAKPPAPIIAFFIFYKFRI